MIGRRLAGRRRVRHRAHGLLPPAEAAPLLYLLMSARVFSYVRLSHFIINIILFRIRLFMASCPHGFRSALRNWECYIWRSSTTKKTLGMTMGRTFSFFTLLGHLLLFHGSFSLLLLPFQKGSAEKSSIVLEMVHGQEPMPSIHLSFKNIHLSRGLSCATKKYYNFKLGILICKT